MIDGRFPIRLLALDIDGTLVGEDLILRERTRAAVAAAVHRGVAVVLVTGRMASSARTFAETLGLHGPLVAYQGGLIRELPAPGSRSVGRLLFHRPLPAEVAREVVAWTRARGLDPHANHLERFIIRADDPRAEDYSAFLGARAELVPDLHSAIRHPISKILAVADEPGPTLALRPAQARFAGRAEVTISHPRFLEFVAPGVSKGRAVRWLSRRSGVPLGHALAIGDQWNDLSMIEAVGHGAAMPTAPLEVRSAARYLARPVADDGAARLIEDLVLAGDRIAAANARRLAEEAAAWRTAVGIASA
jgi:Cof subfamily protein (haloacid dehalogenase superfamily)